MKRSCYIFIFLILVMIIGFGIYYFMHRKTYSNSDFGINDIESQIDFDNDGIDDYADIYNGALNYIKTKPKYKSKYYAGGYPTDEYGVCTDVIWNAFMEAGYNLKDLIDTDINKNKEIYGINKPDSNIDFRRVTNLNIFFKRYAEILTNDITKIEEFHKGDIIVFEKHIAIISEKRNKKGIPYIIHNSGNYKYIEDAISRYKVIGHYRWNKKT